jgi:hypothetical protein
VHPRQQPHRAHSMICGSARSCRLSTRLSQSAAASDRAGGTGCNSGWAVGASAAVTRTRCFVRVLPHHLLRHGPACPLPSRSAPAFLSAMRASPPWHRRLQVHFFSRQTYPPFCRYRRSALQWRCTTQARRCGWSLGRHRPERSGARLGGGGSAWEIEPRGPPARGAAARLGPAPETVWCPFSRPAGPTALPPSDSGADSDSRWPRAHSESACS